jgi:hypothetical protein
MSPSAAPARASAALLGRKNRSGWIAALRGSSDQRKQEKFMKPKFNYRSGAPGGTRRCAIASNERDDKWGFPAGRTLLRDSRAPWQKKGGNPEDNSKMRGLRRLPWSIAGGCVD